MKRTSKGKTNPIPLQGYKNCEQLLEINRDALRAQGKYEKKETAKQLIKEIISWSYSTEEAVGVLDIIKFKLITDSLPI